jgi:hypothetical protein
VNHMAEVLDMVTRRLRGFSPEEAASYGAALTAVGVGLLRGVNGEIFTAEFLGGAIGDLCYPADAYEHPDNPHVRVLLAAGSPTTGGAQ